MDLKAPLIYDSLDKSNAVPQQVPKSRDISYIVPVTGIFLGFILLLILFFTGKYEITRLIGTSIGTQRDMLEWVSLAITLLQLALPVAFTAILANMAYSWIRRNNIVSSLDMPIHVKSLEAQLYTEKLIEGAVAATLARMNSSIYSGVSTLTIDNSTSTSNNSTATAGIAEEKKADTSGLYFNLALLDEVNK